jgi:hypothetical protein
MKMGRAKFFALFLRVWKNCVENKTLRIFDAQQLMMISVGADGVARTKFLLAAYRNLQPRASRVIRLGRNLMN